MAPTTKAPADRAQPETRLGSTFDDGSDEDDTVWVFPKLLACCCCCSEADEVSRVPRKAGEGSPGCAGKKKASMSQLQAQRWAMWNWMW
mmetsp:Transcript_95788/g.200220  ORF Transcript_95788/g.200220 Transcript_95788/m.200220 type:complete len:89 (+) Transcript_95788:219-485(+)